jgi:hypothetical protein
MRRGRMLLVAVGAILLTCQQVGAEDEAERHLKRSRWWLGTWDFRITEGNEVVDSELVITETPASILVVGPGTSVWGYDPHLKKWVGTGFETDGNHFRDVVESDGAAELGPGVVQDSQRTIWRANGDKITARQTWSYGENDTVTIRQERTTDQGVRLPDIVMECRRRPPGPHRAMLDAFARDHVGTWTSEEVADTDLGPLKAGAKYLAQFTFAWSPNREALHLHYAVEFEGSQFFRTHGIAGWDATKNAVVLRWFNDQGATGEFVYTPNGTNWSFDFQWQDADRVQSVSQGTITVTGDAQRITTTSRKTGDENLGETESTFTRKK